MIKSKGAVSAILKIYIGSLTAPSPVLLTLLDSVIAELEQLYEPKPVSLGDSFGVEDPTLESPQPLMTDSTDNIVDRGST